MKMIDVKITKRFGLRYNNCLVLNKTRKNNETVQLADNILADLLKQLSYFGYCFDAKAIEILRSFDESEIKKFQEELIDLFEDITKKKDLEKFYPMYKNFPKSVMGMDEAILYLNAFIHYLGIAIGVRILPKENIKKRIKRESEFKKLKIISIIDNKKEFINDIIKKIVNSESALSFTDRENLRFYIEEYNGKIVVEEIKNKEILAYIANILYKRNRLNEIKSCIKTATDILRVITALSDGDISLQFNTKYKKFKRSERCIFLSVLNNINNCLEDLKRHRERWLRIFEILHPEDYKKKYSNIYQNVKKLRNKDYGEIFNSVVTQLMEEIAHNKKGITKLRQYLITRPGEYARRLDFVLRYADNIDEILKEFKEKISNKITISLLLQLYEHFKNPNCDKRVFILKNGKTIFQEDNKRLTDIKVKEKTVKVIEKIIVNRLKNKHNIDKQKIYIDERLKHIKLPLKMRNTSGGNLIPRFSKLPLEEKRYIRLFLAWKDNQHSRVDLDLSAAFRSPDLMQCISYISYQNLKDKKINSCHSGDITSAPKGASEYIDIDIKACLNAGVRYVMFTVHSYTQQMFSELEYAFCGYMMRQYPNCNEIHDIRSIQHQIDLTTESRNILLGIFDLFEMQFIWTDIPIKDKISIQENITSQQSALYYLLNGVLYVEIPNMYDLLKIYSKANKLKEVDKEEAEILFTIEKENIGKEQENIDASNFPFYLSLISSDENS